MTRQDITQLLAVNDKAVARALVVLYNNQTPDEQAIDATLKRNGRGFTSADALVGTSMARFYLKNGFLTSKQISFWRRPRKDGNMKIAIYWRQLAEAAAAKAASKTGE